MTSKSSKYSIRPDAPPLTKVKNKSSAMQRVAGSLYKSSLRKTYAICFLSCTLCGSYAYYVWSHKPPKKSIEEDHPVTETIDTHAAEENKTESFNESDPSAILRNKGFIDTEAPDFSLSRHCISNNPKVVLNEELGKCCLKELLNC